MDMFSLVLLARLRGGRSLASVFCRRSCAAATYCASHNGYGLESSACFDICLSRIGPAGGNLFGHLQAGYWI